MEKVFEMKNVVLFENEDKIVGNVTQKEAVQALEDAGVEALKDYDFEAVIATAALSAKVMKNYEQSEELDEDPVEDDETLQSLLEIITEAYEDGSLDDLIVMMAMTHLHTKQPIIESVKEFDEFCKKG